jgi:Glucodextranase, domain B/Carboxypeptidase regulatory-like domain
VRRFVSLASRRFLSIGLLSGALSMAFAGLPARVVASEHDDSRDDDGRDQGDRGHHDGGHWDHDFHPDKDGNCDHPSHHPRATPTASCQRFWGPQRYERTHGAKDVFTATVSVPSSAVAPFVLHVQNGDGDGDERVTAAWIAINGVDVASPSDFGSRVAGFDKTVSLASTNQLKVTLAGEHEAFLSLQLCGATAAPTATATRTPTATPTVTPTTPRPTVTATRPRPTVTATMPPPTATATTPPPTATVTTPPPTPTATTPPPTPTATPVPDLTISASVAPSPSEDGWYKTDVTVTFRCDGGVPGTVICPGPVTVTTEGSAQAVIGMATDGAGHSALASVTLSIDKTPPVVALTAPANGTFQRVPRVDVSGTASDANGILSISVNGSPMPVGGTFAGQVPLQSGLQTLVATAVDLAGNVGSSAGVSVTYQSQPVVKITSPANLAAFGASPITVKGTVDIANATVVVGVQKVPALVTGNSFTAANVPLQEGGNVLTAVASDGSGNVGTDSITVVLDTVAPRVLIDSPASGAVTAASSITVTGRVNDTVLGTINSGQAQVTVNGIPASVSNRTFQVQGVPIHPGDNAVVAVARDVVGNSDSQTITVVQAVIADLRLVAVSGDQQAAGIGEALPQPLVVQVTNAGGQPIPGRTVVFRVAENSGSLADGQGRQSRAFNLDTDDQGLAQVRLTLGSRAGVGNNRVDVTLVPLVTDAVLTVPTVSFTASAATHPASKINADSGTGQKGIVGQALPRPFVAVVTDEGHNRLANVPVTFKVGSGGGDLSGQSSLTVSTDSDGRALAVLTLGPQAGVEGNTVSATAPNLSGLPAVFKGTGYEPGDPAGTRITGVVLDNSNLPIPGVTLRIRGTALATQSDEQGYFAIAGVPVGDEHLTVDGSTAQRPGTWPDLEFEVVTVPGVNNTLGMPIYLTSLDTQHGIFVDETHGGTLTLPDYPGFSLTVAPNSGMFPDGTRHGTISVTVVHADKVPMVPNFGQQPRFIVTIQPPGVRFDPPARVTHPNVDGLPPGQVTELYSFDHDMGSFVATGTATVSADGSILVSDPGTGILKGGWHCGGNPNSSGAAAKCPECAPCDGEWCQPKKLCSAKCGEFDGSVCDGTGQCAHGTDVLPKICDKVKVVKGGTRTLNCNEMLSIQQGRPITGYCGPAMEIEYKSIDAGCPGADFGGTILNEVVTSDGGCSGAGAPPEVTTGNWIVVDQTLLVNGISATPGTDWQSACFPVAQVLKKPDGFSCVVTHKQTLSLGPCPDIEIDNTFKLVLTKEMCK